VKDESGEGERPLAASYCHVGDGDGIDGGTL